MSEHLSRGDWDQALDALEEWTRRTEQALLDGDVVLPPAPEALPPGPVPATHQVRALALAARLRSAEQTAGHRRAALERGQRYGVA
ncbi:MAG: hypothetical protein WCD35_08290 [Mycobacteriales bacterium]